MAQFITQVRSRYRAPSGAYRHGAEPRREYASLRMVIGSETLH